MSIETVNLHYEHGLSQGAGTVEVSKEDIDDALRFIYELDFSYKSEDYDKVFSKLVQKHNNEACCPLDELIDILTDMVQRKEL